MTKENNKALTFILDILNRKKPSILSINDSKEFIRLVKHNRFDNLLLHLEPKLKDYLAPEIYQRLLAISKQSKLQSFNKAAALIKIARQLKQANIPFVVLKGMPLSVQLYNDFSVKHSWDIDILIDPNNHKKAIEILHKSGFKSRLKINSINLFNYNDFVYKNPEKDIILELHLRFFNNPFLLPFKEHYLTETKGQRIGDEIIPCLKNSLYYLYLIVHAKKHNWQRLSWIFDALELRKTLTADEVIEVKILSKKMGLFDTFKQYETHDLNYFSNLSHHKPYKGIKRFQLLFQLNSKLHYKLTEIIHRLFIPYRLLNPKS